MTGAAAELGVAVAEPLEDGVLEAFAFPGWSRLPPAPRFPGPLPPDPVAEGDAEEADAVGDPVVDGAPVGAEEPGPVGACVGAFVGACVGLCVGACDGDGLGWAAGW